MERPAESTEYHTHLLRCSIEVEHSRAYWRHVLAAPEKDTAAEAFTGYWFGARSMPRVQLLVSNFRQRFDAFPPALSVLHRWNTMESHIRRVICHWHLQLSDRLYREFTGSWLVDRRMSGRTGGTRDLVVRWLEAHVPGRWAMSTRIQFARRLLHAATEAGLLRGTKDPRELQTPRVSGEALSYMLHLLRGVEFQGSLPANPYLASVGITAQDLERRARTMPGITFRRQGDLFEFDWKHSGLAEWADSTVLQNGHELRGWA